MAVVSAGAELFWDVRESAVAAEFRDARLRHFVFMHAPCVPSSRVAQLQPKVGKKLGEAPRFLAALPSVLVPKPAS
jgi:hypothetical protein